MHFIGGRGVVGGGGVGVRPKVHYGLCENGEFISYRTSEEKL